jgi:ankyrin repeat protein
MVQCLVKELGANVEQANHEGATPLYIAAQEGKLAVVQCLVKELGADVNKAAIAEQMQPLHIASFNSHLELVRCLVLKLHAGVNKGNRLGATPLFSAAKQGDLAMVRLLVRELGADVDKADLNGVTPLMAASFEKHVEVVRWLVKAAGADTQEMTFEFIAADGSEWTAAAISKGFGASAEQTAYLEAKTHCSYPGCSGTGLLKCTACRQARYCGQVCQLAH